MYAKKNWLYISFTLYSYYKIFLQNFTKYTFLLDTIISYVQENKRKYIIINLVMLIVVSTS